MASSSLLESLSDFNLSLSSSNQITTTIPSTIKCLQCLRKIISPPIGNEAQANLEAKGWDYESLFAFAKGRGFFGEKFTPPPAVPATPPELEVMLSATTAADAAAAATTAADAAAAATTGELNSVLELLEFYAAEAKTKTLLQLHLHLPPPAPPPTNTNTNTNTNNTNTTTTTTTSTLTPQETSILTSVNTALRADFAMRRKMLLKRCDVTISAFSFSSSLSGGSLAANQKKGEAENEFDRVVGGMRKELRAESVEIVLKAEVEGAGLVRPRHSGQDFAKQRRRRWGNEGSE